METNTEIARSILADFHRVWPLTRLKTMTLEEYVSVGDKLTFTQYVEHRTKPLGSINGRDSSKFGIWKRRIPTQMKVLYAHVGEYSWPKRFPFVTIVEAFSAVKQEILDIVNAAQKGDFRFIDETRYLSDMFKWKVAYLYSSERLISIFSREVLQRIASNYQLPRRGKLVPVSTIQFEMMRRKPFDMSIYEFSNYLFNMFSPAKKQKDDNSRVDGHVINGIDGRRGKRTKRKAAKSKNTVGHARKGSADSFINQEHNRLQELLKAQLEAKYGSSAVLMEHNYVDLKVQTKQGYMLYEVKSAGYASACMEEALGQILRYAFNQAEGTEDAIQLIIAGKYSPNESDQAYINFVKQKLSIPLNYIVIDK